MQLRDFRNKGKAEDAKRTSSNAFNDYVDNLVKNGAGSDVVKNTSARAARKEYIKQCHEGLKQQQREQKAAMDKLRYEQKQMQRRARGKGQVDLEERLYEEKVSRIAINVLSNVAANQRRDW